MACRFGDSLRAPGRSQMDLPNNGAGGLGQSAAGYENGRAGGRVGVADWESVSVHSDIGGSLGQDANQMHGLNSKCVTSQSISFPLPPPSLCAAWRAFMLSRPAPFGRLSRYIKFTSALETNNKVRAAAQDHRGVGSLCHPAAAGCSALVCLRPPPCRSCTSKSWRCATRSSSCAMSSSLVRPRSATTA